MPVNAGSKHRVVFRPSGSSTFVLEAFDGTSYRPTSIAPVVALLSEPAPRVVGVAQVTPEVIPGGDGYGRLVGVLFSRPMAKLSL